MLGFRTRIRIHQNENLANLKLVLWILIRIQEPPGSGSVFGILIRIHTCKYM